MKIPIYKWSGKYWGFIYNNYLFDANSNYKGWIGNNMRVWDNNGNYLGELIKGNYILKNTNIVEPVSNVPKVPPIPPVSPMPRIDKVGKVEKVGWVDPLD